MNNFTKNIALECGPANIRANTVLPALVHTELATTRSEMLLLVHVIVQDCLIWICLTLNKHEVY